MVSIWHLTWKLGEWTCAVSSYTSSRTTTSLTFKTSNEDLHGNVQQECADNMPMTSVKCKLTEEDKLSPLAKNYEITSQGTSSLPKALSPSKKSQQQASSKKNT